MTDRGTEDDASFRTIDGVPCPKCRVVLFPTHERFVDCFCGRRSACADCGETMDWWQFSRDWLLARKDFPAHWFAFGLVGAMVEYRRVPLLPDRASIVDFADWGVPADAEILALDYTVVLPGEQQGPFPYEAMHEQLRHGSIAHHLHVYGGSHGRQLTEPGELMVSLKWVPSGPDQIAATNLANGWREFAAGPRRYPQMIMSANVAVEASLVPIVRPAVAAVCSRRQLGRADYHHYLNVLAPLLCAIIGAARLPDAIQSGLNDLRDRRNQIAHRGHLEAPLDKGDAISLLVSAAFGYHYAHYLEEEIVRAQGEGRLPVGQQS